MGEERCAESPRGMVAKVGRTDGLSSAGGRIPPRRRGHASTMTEREAPPRQGASVFLYVDRGRVGGGARVRAANTGRGDRRRTGSPPGQVRGNTSFTGETTFALPTPVARVTCSCSQRSCPARRETHGGSTHGARGLVVSCWDDATRIELCDTHCALIDVYCFECVRLVRCCVW